MNKKEANKKRWNNLKSLVIVIVLMLLSGFIDALPWWFFIVPVIGFGIVTALAEWEVSAFTVGCAGGFIVWCGLNLYYDYTGYGIILNKVGAIIAVSKPVILIVSGVPGAILAGLALYTGNVFIARNKIISLEDRA
ncbi:MAG: hypothetical protein JWO09_5 [Bacteroidetes bacterium]|nr:hypothetical protein [Bacteroidota bacterium]